jgi:hypothetical protein
MPPRWIKTKDHFPRPIAPRYEDDDWLLLSGEFVVGRVLPASGGTKTQLNWSLTGPHTPEAPVERGGTADDVESAKAALLAAWRAWQYWAGVQDRPDQ